MLHFYKVFYCLRYTNVSVCLSINIHLACNVSCNCNYLYLGCTFHSMSQALSDGINVDHLVTLNVCGGQWGGGVDGVSQTCPVISNVGGALSSIIVWLSVRPSVCTFWLVGVSCSMKISSFLKNEAFNMLFSHLRVTAYTLTFLFVFIHPSVTHSRRTLFPRNLTVYTENKKTDFVETRNVKKTVKLENRHPSFIGTVHWQYRTAAVSS